MPPLVGAVAVGLTLLVLRIVIGLHRPLGVQRQRRHRPRARARDRLQPARRLALPGGVGPAWTCPAAIAATMLLCRAHRRHGARSPSPPRWRRSSSSRSSSSGRWRSAARSSRCRRDRRRSSRCPPSCTCSGPASTRSHLRRGSGRASRGGCGRIRAVASCAGRSRSRSPAAAVLLALATPALDVRFTGIDASALPTESAPGSSPTSSTRRGLRGAASPLNVVFPGPPPPRAAETALAPSAASPASFRPDGGGSRVWRLDVLPREAPVSRARRAGSSASSDAPSLRRGLTGQASRLRRPAVRASARACRGRSSRSG